MSKIKSLVFDHPIIFSLLLMVAFSFLTEINLDFILGIYFKKQNSSYLQGVISQGLCSILLVGVIYKLGILKQAKFTKPREWRELYHIWPIIILSLIMVVDYFGNSNTNFSDPWTIIFYILVYLSTGFIEEILCRGLTATLFIKRWGTSKKGIYFSVILSSVFFGILHIVNYLMGRAMLLDTLSQIVYATFFGVFFAACMLRSNSIWVVIMLHAVFDICGCLNEISTQSTFGKTHAALPSELLTSIILTLPLLLYGLFILRKIKPEKMPPSLL